MTTQPVGTRGSVYVSGGATGYAAQPVTWSSLRRSMPAGRSRLREQEFTKSGLQMQFPRSETWGAGQVSYEL